MIARFTITLGWLSFNTRKRMIDNFLWTRGLETVITGERQFPTGDLRIQINGPANRVMPTVKALVERFS